MAKQTFTTGQVLLASQLTSLQQTAMLGGAASAKTASYTLVAADAGTAISMTSTSATTITVNTGLFAAGDTVQITNLSTGVATITAGTATVNTSASLALAQYESGTLDFTSTSAAIFIKGAGAAAASGGMTLISTTTFDNTVITYTLSSIPQTYKHLLVIGNGLQSDAAAADTTFFRFNGDTGANYGMGIVANNGGSVAVAGDPGNGRIFHPSICNMARTGDASSRFGNFTLNIYDYTATSYKAITYFAGSCNNGSGFMAAARGLWNNTSAITSITFQSEAGSNLKAGTVRLYGVS